MKLQLIIIMLILMPCVFAVPPIIAASSSTGACEIKAPIFYTIQKGVSFDFNFHVFNSTNSIPLTNQTLLCNLHVYNSTGDHILGLNILADPVSEHGVNNEWTYRVNGNNFSSTGEYSYIFQCNNSVTGCFYGSNFEVTESGKAPIDGIVVIFFSMGIILILGLTLWLSLYSIGHLVTLDFDLIDLAFDIGAFISFVTFYALEKQYFGWPIMDTYFTIFLYTSGVFLVLIPIIALILTMTIGPFLQQPGSNVNFAPPQRRRSR